MSINPILKPSEEPQILDAFVGDLRHFTNLLRGINFANRALVDVTEGGLVITVEEARTLSGISDWHCERPVDILKVSYLHEAVAFIRKDIFDEYHYTPDAFAEPKDPDNSDTEDEDPSQPRTLFEIPLNTFIECLNVLGTANQAVVGPPKRRFRPWNATDQESDHEDESQADGEEGPSRANQPRSAASALSGGIERYLGGKKGTALRMTYQGPGYPLVLLISEDSNGPIATCEISTYEPEPTLELPFDSDDMQLKMILKSSWLQDNLSELHPSCEKLTIIGNPPPAPGKAPSTSAPPRLRIKATGTFGSSEMDYPNDKEVLESCECNAHVSFTYRTQYVCRVLPALRNSTKTSIRIDGEGLLSVQLIIPSPRLKGPEAFTEFRTKVRSD
ncbi:Rad1-domain-containing protein [Panus rudis PR-1116 ss-1]|nr:Rad1-domain-containing protein [Panus rudis PR-1116 ss-1]